MVVVRIRSRLGSLTFCFPEWKVFNGGSDRVGGLPSHLLLHLTIRTWSGGAAQALNSRVSLFPQPRPGSILPWFFVVYLPSFMSSTPREIGTLIVIILKANHLPNKRNFGKQDPFCLVSLNGEEQRTKAIKRGGQHPEWDEEIRFKLYEDALMPDGPDGAPSPLPPKDGRRNIKGGTVMKLSCFANNFREPSLIGQADVDLTEVLTKGETDEWFTLMNKEKFAGKVFIELTFWSNEPAPHSRRVSDSGHSTLRSSNSLPHHRSRVASFSTLANDFDELGLGDPSRRRESLPLVNSGFVHTQPPSSSYRRATYPPPQHGYDPAATSGYAYDRPVIPPGQPHDSSAFVNPGPYIPQAPYRLQYDSRSVYNPPPSRGPRYSSGFMPISNSNSSSFAPLPSHPSEPSSFAPSLTHTSAPPAGYPPSHINPATSYPPATSQTPAPGYAPPLPPSSSAGFHYQPGFLPSQSQYSQFQPQQQYNPPPSHIQTPTPPAQGYVLPPSPSNQSPASLSYSNSLSSSTGPGSRLLLPPPQFHAGQGHQSYSLPPGASQPPHPGSYSPTPPGASTFQENYQPLQPYQDGGYVGGHIPGDPFLGVLKASYDYDPDGADKEISVKEGQLLHLKERVDSEYIAAFLCVS
ncbi:hypothetical protein B0H14DRAFT_389248 [Mycena olivaceomarginata]|nr:hypothetical protein B0H14DRAFT_389248 [Mycena olivaceomarginata]